MDESLASTLFQPHPTSAVWIAAFGGMQLFQPVPDFEWHGSLDDLPVGRLFVRDPAQYWYLPGLPDLGPDIAASAAELRRRLDDHGCRRLICLGASTGGYAALLYGSLLGAAEIHALSPMTVIPSRTILEVAQLVRSANWRLIGKHIRLRRDRVTGAAHRDLRPILQQAGGRSSVHIYYGDRHPADRRNARHLDGLPAVTLHPIDDHHHNIARRLRDSGELAAILAGAVAEGSGDTSADRRHAPAP